MKIDKKHALDILRTEAANAETGSVSESWSEKVEQLSQLCEQGVSKTHIAFLGTAMLAKSVNASADLFAIKPNHARDNPNAFSARSLCHGTLVPLSAELGISLGVSGREPLNNQPYFRMTRLDDDTPVHSGGREAFDYMLCLVHELQDISDEADARAALGAFIAVRRKYQPRYVDHEGDRAITPDDLLRSIEVLIRDSSEGGKRAQAVVAGLVDVFAGPDRVESGRINDPSRKHPGDVCVALQNDPDQWEKAIEVRDKPVAASDVQIFGKKCADMGVREAALVMVSDQQQQLDDAALYAWADEYGIGLTLFYGWEKFVDQVLYWSELPKPVGASRAIGFIHDRLINVEASPDAVALWQSRCRT